MVCPNLGQMSWEEDLVKSSGIAASPDIDQNISTASRGRQSRVHGIRRQAVPWQISRSHDNGMTFRQQTRKHCSGSKSLLSAFGLCLRAIPLPSAKRRVASQTAAKLLGVRLDSANKRRITVPGRACRVDQQTWRCSCSCSEGTLRWWRDFAERPNGSWASPGLASFWERDDLGCILVSKHLV